MRLVLGRSVAVTALVILAACSQESGTAPQAVGSASEDVPQTTAAVEIAQLARVTTLEATAESGVTIRLPAPVDGEYSFSDGVITVTTAESAAREVKIPAPFDLVDELAPEGEVLQTGTAIATLRAETPVAVAPLTRENAPLLASFEEKGHGQVIEGPGPFDCLSVGPTPVRIESDPAGLYIVCAFPKEVDTFPGQPMKIAMAAQRSEEHPVLPLEAVSADSETGYVWVESSAEAKELRRVTLGESDGVRIEILKGLEKGDDVLLPPPTLVDVAGSS